MTEMTDTTTFRDPGEPPVIDWIDKTLIDIDPAYQRGLDEARVQRILDWFEWRSFGAVVIARGDDGRYRCIDGQHRLEAAKRHPNIDHVPAVIIAEAGTQREAEVFVAVNRDRKNVSPIELYWAQLAAGDPEAETVRLCCVDAGVTIVRYLGADYKPAQTVAVSAIRAVVDSRGRMRARQVLEMLANARVAPITGLQVRAAELLLHNEEFCNDVEPAALSESLELNTSQIAAEAKAFAKTHCLPAAKAYASVWFRKTRKRRKAAA